MVKHWANTVRCNFADEVRWGSTRFESNILIMWPISRIQYRKNRSQWTRMYFTHDGLIKLKILIETIWIGMVGYGSRYFYYNLKGTYVHRFIPIVISSISNVRILPQVMFASLITMINITIHIWLGNSFLPIYKRPTFLYYILFDAYLTLNPFGTISTIH